jgi:DNA-damage-inducible protein D
VRAEGSLPAVAAVQAYLGRMADEIARWAEQAVIVDRLVFREELREGMKSLFATAHRHGVEYYGKFANAGYRGMYNMSLSQLEELKGLPFGETLMDRMTPAELAANHFRVTQTEQKITLGNIRGQVNLEKAAHEVGQVVRDAMIRTTGQRPEELPLMEHVSESKKKLKSARKRLDELSTPEASQELQFQTVQERYLVDPHSAEHGFVADPEDEGVYEYDDEDDDE